MSKYVLISYTETWGLQMDGVFDTKEAAWNKMREAYEGYSYDPRIEENPNDAFIDEDDAYRYGNEWQIVEVEV